MREESAKDEGWIAIATMLTFNRLKQLTEDATVVAKVASEMSDGLIEVSEDGTKIRRSVEKPLTTLSEEEMTELNARTLHVKGFSRNNPPSLDEITVWAKKFGEIEGIEMRRFPHTKKFKGCIMVVFKKREDAEKILNTEILKFTEDCALIKEDK